MTLKYIREYRTYFHVSQSYGISESSTYKRLVPADGEVIKSIKKRHAIAEQTHSVTQEVYKAMAQLYAEHPKFRKQVHPFYPELDVF